MASLFCTRRSLSLFTFPRLRRLFHRHSHTSTLWERLLGQKYEPSLAKALNDAVSQYKASQSVPSWLPFLPNSSFWVPSSEEAAQSLEDLADRLNDSDGDSDSEIDLSSTDCNPDSQSFSHGNLNFDDDVDEEEDDDESDANDEVVPSSTAFTAFQITDKLLDIHRQSPIEQGTTLFISNFSST